MFAIVVCLVYSYVCYKTLRLVFPLGSRISEYDNSPHRFLWTNRQTFQIYTNMNIQAAASGANTCTRNNDTCMYRLEMFLR